MMIADEPAAKEQNLHVLFLPLFSQGHMIPLFDTARLFAAQDGVQATFVTTLANASSFTEAIEQTQQDYNSPVSDKSPMRSNINVEIIPFPYENEKACLSSSDTEHTAKGYQMFLKFLEAKMQLRQPLETMIDRLKPISCLVTDIFLPWTSKVADQFGIPRLVFHGSSFFATSIMDVMLNQQRTQKDFHSYEEEFEMDPDFPSNIKLTKTDIEFLGENPVAEFLKSGFELERRSFGTIMNSFYELESEYADYSRQVLGKRVWTIGPISLCINRNNSDKAKRGKKAAIDELDCLNWLDSKHPNSVIYVSLGSQADIPSTQLREIAIALEASELNFIWVIKTTQKTSSEQQQEVEEEWLLDSEFEERNRGKGLIIRGWAPQVLVLDHQATGAFVTHCEWNSVI